MTSNAPAGWYPAEPGQMRYWDGAAWTDQVRRADEPVKSSRLKDAATAAAGRLTSNEHEFPEGALWSALGKGVGGVTTGRYHLDIYYLYLAKGALRTDSQQVPIADVVDVDVRQSMTQKARGVSTVVVHVQRGTGREVVTMDDIRDGAEAQRVINATARDARLYLTQQSIQIDGLRHQATNTIRQEVSYEQRPAVPVAASITTAPEIIVDAVEASLPTEDPFAMITKLASLRDAGVLTEDEFAAKKAELLARL